MEIRTLLASRRVCKKWKSLIETQVLKERAILEGFTRGLTNEDKMNVEWTTWYLMLSPNSLFNRNLVKNPCGQGNPSFILI
jgi:F-box domain.